MATKNYMGSDGVIRERAAHVTYLRRCAARWEAEATGYGKTSVYAAECREQAARVLAEAERITTEAE